MSRLIALLAFGLTVIHVHADPVRTLLTIEPSKEFPRSSEADLIELRDGRLLLVYSRFYGGTADGAAAQLVGRTSGDDGNTGSADRVGLENEGEMNVLSSNLIRLPDGELLLFYLRKNGWGDCHVYVRSLSDDLDTLGEPVRVSSATGYHVLNNDRVIQLKSGRLVVPTSLHLCPDGTQSSWTKFGIPVVYYSDDNGMTWRYVEREFTPPDKAGVLLQEPGVLELLDGRLWMWMRTDSGSQFEMFSTDGGVSWTEPKASVIASPRSPASIERVPWSNELLCVWNDHSGWHAYPKGKRTPLCIATSADEGKTWTKSRVIEGDPDGWYCYTSISFVKEQTILSYCAGDSKVGGLNRMKVVALSKQWLSGN